MNFTDALKASAKKAGMREINGTNATVASTSAGFSAALQHAKGLKTDTPKIVETKTPAVGGGAIKVWAFSSLKMFEGCEWAAKLRYVDKIKDEGSPASIRGNAIHDGCEEYVRDLAPTLPHDARTRFEFFEAHFEELKALYAEQRITMEQKWGIRKDWSPCTWDDEDLWGRAKLDVFVIESSPVGDATGHVIVDEHDNELYLIDGDTRTRWNELPPETREQYTLSARVIDYKTGKKFGNEMKHADQGLSYALHVITRYPDVKFLITEFWYLDQGELMKREFNYKMLSILKPRYHGRAQKMTACTSFMPKPSAHNCNYCPFGANTKKDGTPYGSGTCVYDYYRGKNDDH